LPVQVRFIELMPIGESASWDKERFVSSEVVLEACPLLERIGEEGVSELYTIPGYVGTVGLIRPMSHRFCSSCNRIRITSDGRLKPCLHSSAEISLKGLKGSELQEAIRKGVLLKPERHYIIENEKSDSLRSMYEIGG
jgi:cyclic pyranopterin phosphate synthase